jgi:hypothetical protein
MLVSDTTPQPFHEDIIDSRSLAVNTDADLLFYQKRNIQFAGELASLVAVQDFRVPVQQDGFGEDSNDPLCRHAVAQALSDHVSGMDINDRT